MPQLDPTAQVDKLKVFISYSRDDLDIADQIDPALTTVGFEPLLDRKQIDGGGDFRDRLRVLVREADTIVFLLSPSSASSEMCRWEVDEAMRLGKRIIPVITRPLGDAEPHEALKKLDYIFFYPEPRYPGSGFGNGLKRLVKALNEDGPWAQQQTWLLQRATDWEAGGQQDIRLLSGDDIAKANAWMAMPRPKGAAPPQDNIAAFIKASETVEAAKLDTERKRQAREKDTLAEREKAVQDREIAQRTGRNTRRLALAVVLSVTAFSALQWYAAAGERDRTRVTEAVLLAEKARNTGNDGDDMGKLLIALEARSQFEEAWWRQRLRTTIGAIQRRVETWAVVPTSIQQHLEGVRAFDGRRADALLESEQVIQSAMKTGRELVVLTGHDAPVHMIVPHPDGRHLVSGDAKGVLLVWDLQTRKAERRLDGHTDRIRVIAFSPDKKLMLTAGEDKFAILWDTTTWQPTDLKGNHKQAIYAAAFDPTSQRVATASEDHSVHVWRTATGQRERRIDEAHAGRVNHVAFVDDGQTLMTAGDDNLIKLWVAATGERLETWTGKHEAPVYRFALSPDGQYLATASSDGWPQLWRRGPGLGQWIDGHSHKTEMHEAEVLWIEFDKTSQYYLTASPDETARIWKVGQDKPHAVLRGHTDEIWMARFSPSGQHVLTASHDKTARLWDTNNGQVVAALSGHTEDLHAVAFSLDGRLAITAFGRSHDPHLEHRGQFAGQTDQSRRPCHARRRRPGLTGRDRDAQRQGPHHGHQRLWPAARPQARRVRLDVRLQPDRSVPGDRLRRQVGAPVGRDQRTRGQEARRSHVLGLDGPLQPRRAAGRDRERRHHVEDLPRAEWRPARHTRGTHRNGADSPVRLQRSLRCDRLTRWHRQDLRGADRRHAPRPGALHAGGRQAQGRGRQVQPGRLAGDRHHRRRQGLRLVPASRRHLQEPEQEAR